MIKLQYSDNNIRSSKNITCKTVVKIWINTRYTIYTFAKKKRKRGDKRRKEGEPSILQTGYDKRKRSNVCGNTGYPSQVAQYVITRALM